jgi:hypothetical protein
MKETINRSSTIEIERAEPGNGPNTWQDQDVLISELDQADLL